MKKHWTQTKAGRAKLSEIGKSRWRAVKKSTKRSVPNDSSAEAYAFGHCETWLQTFAERTNIPFKPLARRVGELLQYGEGR